MWSKDGSKVGTAATAASAAAPRAGGIGEHHGKPWDLMVVFHGISWDLPNLVMTNIIIIVIEDGHRNSGFSHS